MAKSLMFLVMAWLLTAGPIAAQENKVPVRCVLPQLPAYSEALRQTVLKDLSSKGFNAGSRVRIATRIVRRSKPTAKSLPELIGTTTIESDPQLVYLLKVPVPAGQIFAMPTLTCSVVVDFRIRVQAVRQNGEDRVSIDSSHTSRLVLVGTWVKS